MSELFFYLVLLLLIAMVFGSMAIASFRAAPWVPSRKKDLERLCSLAEIKKGEVIFELGSGDGRILFELAKKYDAQIVGFEISIMPYIISKIRLWLMNTFFVRRLKGEIKILYKDFFLQNLGEAEVIICFLTPRGIKCLEEKFKKELKTGSRLVSYVFPVKVFSPVKVSKPSKTSNSIYLYQI